MELNELPSRTFEGHQLRICGTITNPLYRVSDIATIVKLTNLNQNVANIPNQHVRKLRTPTKYGFKTVLYVTHRGLMYLLAPMTANAVADRMFDWVCDISLNDHRIDETKDTSNRSTSTQLTSSVSNQRKPITTQCQDDHPTSDDNEITKLELQMQIQEFKLELAMVKLERYKLKHHICGLPEDD